MNLLNHYDKFQAALPLKNRGQALEFVRTHQLPTRQDEDWKYTSLKALSEKDFVPAQLASSAQLDHAKMQLIQKQFANHAVNLVFVNGLLDKTLSQELPLGIELTTATDDKKNFVDALEALNNLYAPQHYVLVVKKETSIAKPVHFILWTEGEGVMSSAFVKIQVQTRAKARFIVSHLGGSGEYFANSYVEMQVAENANASLVKVQTESLDAIHIARTHLEIGANAEVENLVFSTGARLGRNTLEVRMNGEGANASVNGVYATTGSQHVDNNTAIDHRVGHCNTNQLYKGLLDGESRAVFNGKVYIRRNAMKANSEQLNNNLLLSRKAEADSKPMLEIDADDVKASHGSTVGQMNKEELFYLLSRAIPRGKAITMMSYGFLSEVLYKLADDQTQSWLQEKLNQAFERLSMERL